MKARKYNSPKLQELLDEITPEEMEETKQQMLNQITMEQTAVELFANEVCKKLLIVGLEIEFNQILEQAKQMEKEQIVEAFYKGVDQESDTHGAQNLDMKDAENYYNENFKTK